MSNTKTHCYLKILAIAAFLFAGASVQADCISNPVRPENRWSAWETVATSHGVDLQVRYYTFTGGPWGTGRENTTVQFQYVNTDNYSHSAYLTGVNGHLLVGEPLWWNRKSFAHVPFSIPDQSVSLAGGETAQSETFTFEGRICKYSIRFYAR